MGAPSVMRLAASSRLQPARIGLNGGAVVRIRCIATRRKPRVLEVAQVDDPSDSTELRRIAAPVSRKALQGRAMQGLIDDMIATVEARDGMGLSAPQVRHSVRVFVLDDGTAVVNPKILKASRETAIGIEG